MKIEAYEKKDVLLETVEDMIIALLETPKAYRLNPLGQQCAMAINHYDKSILLDSVNWLLEYENEIIEEIKADTGSFELDVNAKELEKFNLYYVWSSITDTEGAYSYYLHEYDAQKAYELCDIKEKTYGKAHFANGKLEPYEVIGTSL